MLKFGVIAEGKTDQRVIKNILLGYFDGEEEEPVVTFVQPIVGTFGGWTLVFECLKRGEAQRSLQLNDFLVIHIDTDVQEEPGFDVPRQEQGEKLSLSDRVLRVIARLKRDIDATFFQINGHRILFAIAVDSIECWLLPLLYRDKKKAAKTEGCLESANRALRKTDNEALSAGEKSFIAYEKASSGYRKRKTLTQLRNKNPSLELFIQQLDVLQKRIIANTVGDQPG